MHVISKKQIKLFQRENRGVGDSLDRWYRIITKNEFQNFAELKASFGSVDKVGRFHVFNIGGNKIRLVANIHYNRQKLYIRGIFTHVEYDEDRWKD